MILPDTYLKCQGCHTLTKIWGRRGRDRMVVEFTTT
jgi:hypothetical protein